MKLSNLQKITQKQLKRVGRGQGSGRGKTSGRGTKGQKARGKISGSFEGGALPLIKRLPFLRGRGRNKARIHPVAINVGVLDALPSKTNVDIDMLIARSIVPAKAKKYGVKILGAGNITKSLKVKLMVTRGARKKIEKAGGTVEV
jgi:large subunit ribosomal protein L15